MWPTSNNSDSLTVEFNFYATYAPYCRSDLRQQYVLQHQSKQGQTL
jgi:hypothetical protein